jgi:molybdenum cofactor biosynthesis enzyme MoaA
MNCTVNHSVFLRSNGSLACWCDYGSLKTLQEFDPCLDYATDVYLGKVYGFIREKLAADTMPFPAYCSRCMVLLPSAPFDPRYVRERHIDTLQVEPSMACQLDCPGCIPMRERKDRVAKTWAGHLLLAPKVLEKILRDFHRAGLTIRNIDFQGHGEPLLNKDVWSMFRMAKSLFPATAVTVCTNAIAEFQPEMVGAGLDQIIFAIDGMDQDSYAPYRVHGDFAEAYAFMKAFGNAVHEAGAKTSTVWKYVLFRHNDRPAQLLRAQELAKEARVSELRFIITQLGPASTAIVDEEAIPRAHNGVKILVQNYKVSAEQLSEGLEAVRENLRAHKAAQAAQAASFVAAMLHRLFPESQPVPVKYAGYLRELTALAQEFPEAPRRAVLAEIQHLAAAPVELA